MRLTEGGLEWVAEVTGSEARLAAHGEARTPVASAQPRAFQIRAIDDDRFQVDGPETSVAAIALLTADVVWVGIEGHVFEVRVAPAGRAAHSPTRDHDALAPPMSATVVRIAVAPGDRVRQGDILVSLEAMKMELPIRAPRDGMVTAIHCREGELVQPGVPLIDLD